MASRHVVVERGDPFKENIKNAWNWESWPSEKVRDEEGEGRPTHPQDCRTRNRVLHGVRSHDQLHKQRKGHAH